jgi:MoxR-like ATPase
MAEDFSTELKDLVARVQAYAPGTGSPASGQSLPPSGKIGLSNLGQDVIDYFKQFQPIRLELPSMAIVDIPEGQNPDFWKMMDDLFLGNNIFLHGPAGTGKTTLAEALAYTKAGIAKKDWRETPVPARTINCSQWTGPIDIIGGQTIEGYKEGRLTEAWRDGHMLILDELPKLDPNTAGLLNDALAKAGTPGATMTSGAGVQYVKHPNFCVVGTGNTTMKGTSVQYGGNNKQDASLIDRFSCNYYLVGFDEALEKSLIYPVVHEVCVRIRQEILRLKSDDIMTLRTMLHMNKVYVMEMERVTGKRPAVPNGKTLKDSVESYLSLMSPDIQDKVRTAASVTTFYNTYRDAKRFLDEYAKRAKA